MITNQDSLVSRFDSRDRNNKTNLRAILLMAMGMFLLAAPALDSNDIADISANFFVQANHSTLSSLELGD